MKIVATKNAPDAVGPYSQGMIQDGILYSAGQIALVPETGKELRGSKDAAQECDV